MPEASYQGLTEYLLEQGPGSGEGSDSPWWPISFRGRVRVHIQRNLAIYANSSCVLTENCAVLTSKTHTIACGYTTGISESKAKVREATSF